MPSSTISSKGQITLPKTIREALQVDTGDRVLFIVREDGVVELRPETVDILDLVGILIPPAGHSATVDQMKVAIHKAAAKAHRKSSLP
jgi:AbrB family looped-hinge helix DNA binding protein